MDRIHIGPITFGKVLLINVVFLLYALIVIMRAESSETFVSVIFLLYVLFVLRAYLLRSTLEVAYPGPKYVKRINDLAHGVLIILIISSAIYIVSLLIDSITKVGIATIFFWPLMCIGGGVMLIFGPVILGMTLSQVAKKISSASKISTDIQE